MLRSPHSPPDSAACSSLALVCSSMDPPPPQAESATLATTARAPSRAPRLLAILMVLLLAGAMWWIGCWWWWWWCGNPWVLAGWTDGQADVEGATRAGAVVTAYVGRGAGDPVEHHAEEDDGQAAGSTLAP